MRLLRACTMAAGTRRLLWWCWVAVVVVVAVGWYVMTLFCPCVRARSIFAALLARHEFVPPAPAAGGGVNSAAEYLVAVLCASFSGGVASAPAGDIAFAASALRSVLLRGGAAEVAAVTSTPLATCTALCVCQLLWCKVHAAARDALGIWSVLVGGVTAAALTDGTLAAALAALATGPRNAGKEDDACCAWYEALRATGAAMEPLGRGSEEVATRVQGFCATAQARISRTPNGEHSMPTAAARSAAIAALKAAAELSAARA